MMNASLEVFDTAIENQQEHRGQGFPLVLHCGTSNVAVDVVTEWLREHHDHLLEQLGRHGAILFRGFPIHSPQDFDRFIAAFGLENFPYEQSLSNAVRINYTPRVFSANEAPSDITIFLHHEMAQTPVFPGKLFFYCQQPAQQGGATPLCRSDVLYEAMLRECPDFAQQCEAKGLQYTNVMPSENDTESGMGRSWQSTLRADRREDAERRLSELGYSYAWLSDGCLRATTPILPAVREVYPGTKSFFNQLIAAFQGWKDSRNDPSKAIAFGDGTPLRQESVLQVADLAEQLTFDLMWHAGDVALVDNLLVMHGRHTFQGTRKVMASLVSAQKHLSA